jgi:flagellar biosynthesis protein FliP
MGYLTKTLPRNCFLIGLALFTSHYVLANSFQDEWQELQELSESVEIKTPRPAPTNAWLAGAAPKIQTDDSAIDEDQVSLGMAGTQKQELKPEIPPQELPFKSPRRRSR